MCIRDRLIEAKGHETIIIDSLAELPEHGKFVTETEIWLEHSQNHHSHDHTHEHKTLVVGEFPNSDHSQHIVHIEQPLTVDSIENAFAEFFA